MEKLHNNGLKTLVAIRPLIPTVSATELESLVQLTHQYCSGYYSGPLYLKDVCDINIDRDLTIKINKVQPHWMLSGNEFYQIEKAGQMETLQKIVERSGQILFKGAAEAIKYLKNEKY